MTEQELNIRVAHMVILTKATLDYSYMIKDQLHRQDKQMLSGLVKKINQFNKHFMEDALKDPEVDDALEDSAEYILEGITLLLKALNQGKTTEALSLLNKL